MSKLTRCSSFLLRIGGCSISTVSANTLSVASTFDRTPCSGVMSPPPEMVVKADSMFSDQAIWADRTTSWACETRIKIR